MVNLIIKDILIQKKTLLFTFFYTIVISICFYSANPSDLGLYVLAPILNTYMHIINAVNYDDKNNSEIVLNSLPLNREDVVIAKYISIFVFAIIQITYAILIGLIGKATGLSIYNVSISLFDIGSVFASIGIFSAIFFPLYFKFGAIKMRIFNTILFIIIFIVPMNGISYVIENPNNVFVHKVNLFINNTSSLTINSVVLITGLILFMISLTVSIHIYNKKEF
ncbi:ABC-2 transporter permease [Clostridium estertheticum]|uniref:ABC-2 transporter permease n=1 Tax=Clostridium estertheticum TaxID=238834 RepID=UPI001C0E5D73|nr:ABC-2 transporter permease [Clostridium estertheticum]MBU3213517.1 ABC-2 transporter permease [Clostridium estertheticum]WAG57832.1 ABC-2 transporter permease [Clostridium estertheticum]